MTTRKGREKKKRKKEKIMKTIYEEKRLMTGTKL